MKLAPVGPTMRARRQRSGFTLIELMVVVAIVATLAAVAIPQFRQTKAYDARVYQDARNAAVAEEAYFTGNVSYYAGACANLPSMVVSSGVSCNASLVGQGYQIATSHPQASRSCVWSTATTPNLICTP